MSNPFTLEVARSRAETAKGQAGWPECVGNFAPVFQELTAQQFVVAKMAQEIRPPEITSAQNHRSCIK